MKNLAISILFLSLSCSHTPPAAEPEPPNDPSMQLIGRYGIGHACPVEGNIITAAHVAEQLFPSGKASKMAYVYQQGRRNGFVNTEFTLGSRDMAVLRLYSGEAPSYQIRADKVPEPGQDVYWYEYSFNRGIFVVRRGARVQSFFAGHITFSPAPSPGSSGGCLLDANGFVVGIITWSFGPSTGVAPAIVGKWGPQSVLLDNGGMSGIP